MRNLSMRQEAKRFIAFKFLYWAFYVIVIGVVLLAATIYGHASEGGIYLDQLNHSLDAQWNALDGACRNSPDDDQACNERLELDRVIKGLGCHNIYPATKRGATSYWICRRISSRR